MKKVILWTGFWIPVNILQKHSSWSKFGLVSGQLTFYFRNYVMIAFIEFIINSTRIRQGFVRFFLFCLSYWTFLNSFSRSSSLSLSFYDTLQVQAKMKGTNSTSLYSLKIFSGVGVEWFSSIQTFFHTKPVHLFLPVLTRILSIHYLF